MRVRTLVHEDEAVVAEPFLTEEVQQTEERVTLRREEALVERLDGATGDDVPT